MKFFTWLFSTFWVGFQIMTGQKKVMALRAEKPPVPLVVFRQSSRFLVLWPVVVLTWAMAIYMPLLGPPRNATNLVEIKATADAAAIETVLKEEFTGDELKGINHEAVLGLAKEANGYIFGSGHKNAGQVVPWFRNPYTLGGWWAVIVCFAVLILRVRMRAPLTIAIIALIFVFYFWLDKIGNWAPFLQGLRKFQIFANGGSYALLALIPSVDIFIVWLYARFHYFIATPNKGFMVWGMYASERPVEYGEHELKIDVEDVVERTFGFGALELRHKSNPSLSKKFPCVWRIAKKMSRFNEITTEVRVKTIKAAEAPPSDD